MSVTDIPNQVAAVAANTSSKKKKRLPQTADGWSMFLAWILTFFIPLWFLGSHYWSPAYVPQHGWVWAVPWIFVALYDNAQLWFLIASVIGRSEKIGMADMVISGISFVSALITSVALVILWALGHYQLGGIQWHILLAFLFATLSELVATVGTRMLVNRRYFSTVTSGGDNSNN